MQRKIVELSAAVVRFAGDSGDGMQTVGELFADNSAVSGNDVSTFPDYPAEIRAPQGTIAGVSGFQVQFGGTEILTPGDEPDALVAMNPAALKACIDQLPKKGLLVVNSDAFTEANLSKAGYETNPLETGELEDLYTLVEIGMTSMTQEALVDSGLKPGERSRCKNFFALGFTYWLYDRNPAYTIEWIEKKWAKKPEIADANVRALRAGYNFGDITQSSVMQHQVSKATVAPGVYRKISGNEAVALGLVTAAHLAGKQLVLGSYPITPATSILETLARYKNFGVKTVQAEDELCGIGVAIGAAYAGEFGVTTTSGPGMCLKGEFLGLAVISELPLVIVNVQRGGPSTGLPTKTEQSDLLQALYGRNGECPMPVLAAGSPGDCFSCVVEAARIAFKYSTPVIVLSDGYIANGAEPWPVPELEDLEPIQVRQITHDDGSGFSPYKRDPETLSRDHAPPGTPGLEHRLGGLEKDESGLVSYDRENHHKMCKLRIEKVARVAQDIAPLNINGNESGKLLVLGWGGTWGAITVAVNELREAGVEVSSVHLRHLNPLPSDLGDILDRFDRVLVPELNNGQLAHVIRAEYLKPVVPFGLLQGRPFRAAEIKEKITEMLAED
jgi:2-oxoglutarate ferredoxin oxidoreductase subunit alpha